MPIYPRGIERRIKSLRGTRKLDVLNLTILMSDEATEEINRYFQSPLSMVDANGELIWGLSAGRIVKYSLFATSYHPLPIPA